jgi:hypothetical protein
LAISDDQVLEQQPAIRAQLVDHLLRLLELSQTQLELTGEEGHTDPRWAELQVRVLDRVARLFRLWERPVQQPEEPDDGRRGLSTDEARSLVLAQLRELRDRAAE